ncbi:MAG: isopropylmalate isomerase [Candidatus Paceibacterota bacterium]
MAITRIGGRAFHLAGADVDTDRIIPARYLRCVTFDGLEQHVFEDDRAQLNGQHPFDLSENIGRSVLIVDANFGCGSSREHAVAAIQRWGIKVIIGQSFAEIFRGNATANGLVCVDVSEQDHARILHELGKKDSGVIIYLDTLRAELKRSAESMAITMPFADRDMLVGGTYDTTATLLQAGDQIEETASRLPYMVTD